MPIEAILRFSSSALVGATHTPASVESVRRDARDLVLLFQELLDNLLEALHIPMQGRLNQMSLLLIQRKTHRLDNELLEIDDRVCHELTRSMVSPLPTTLRLWLVSNAERSTYGTDLESFSTEGTKASSCGRIQLLSAAACVRRRMLHHQEKVLLHRA